MPLPVCVGAGAGVAILTGSGTVSKSGCVAGNLLVQHLVVRGASEDWSGISNVVNWKNLAGVSGQTTGVQTGLGIGTGSVSRHALFASRVIADGVCSGDFTVGVSGEDLFLRMYEFSGASPGATVAAVFENGGSHYGAVEGTSVAVADSGVVTNGADRLACQFVGIGANQAVESFAGETGGDWTEAVAEYASAEGVAATLQLQTAPMAAAGTIDGGTQTIVSAAWGSIGLAIIASFAPNVMLPMGAIGMGRV